VPAAKAGLQEPPQLFVKFGPLLVPCFARWFLERKKSIEQI
jgi:hypothetical protein